MQQPKIIRVQGHATVSKNPDTVILSFSISGRDKKYDESIKSVNNRVEILRNELEKSQVDRTALKTTNFSINSDFRYDDKNKENIFLGYICNHALRLELPFNKKEVGKIIDNLAISMSQAEMRISFDVKDKESLHQEILEKAVLEARNNAGILVKSAGVRLGSIINIEYGWTEIRFQESLSYSANMVCASMADIEPEDIQGQDSVTITWEILEN